MKKNIWNTAQVAIVAVLISFVAIGCASSMATEDELSQLETINMEIQSLEKQKADLQKEQQALMASISDKESQLSDINNRKQQLGQ